MTVRHITHQGRRLVGRGATDQIKLRGYQRGEDPGTLRGFFFTCNGEPLEGK